MQEMNMMKVNETHDHAVYEKMKVLAHTISGLLQKGNIFPINFNFTFTRQVMS